MPSTFDPLLRLELQASGENLSTWGTKTNNNLNLIGQAVASHVSVAAGGSGDLTLTASNAASDQSRRASLTLSGALTGNRNIIVPSAAKTYIIRDNTSAAGTITVKTASGTGVSIVRNAVSHVFCDGTEVYLVGDPTKLPLAGDPTKLPLAGGTVTGDITMSGTGALKTPSGTTANRPGSPANGMLRYNSTLSRMEMYDNAAWRSIGRDSQLGWELLSSSVVTGVGDVVVDWPENVYRRFAIHLIGWRYASASANDMYYRIKRGGTIVAGVSDYQNSGTVWISGVGTSAVIPQSIALLTSDGSNGEPSSHTIELDHHEVGQRPAGRAYTRWTANTPAHAHGLFTVNIAGGSGWLSGIVVGVIGATPNIAAGRITVLGLRA